MKLLTRVIVFVILGQSAVAATMPAFTRFGEGFSVQPKTEKKVTMPKVMSPGHFGALLFFRCRRDHDGGKMPNRKKRL